MVFVGLVCFYILMCVMGVNWWLAIAGAIAFAFASYNIIIIVAGHIVKALCNRLYASYISGDVAIIQTKMVMGRSRIPFGSSLFLI